jgi:hypothetical protein
MPTLNLIIAKEEDHACMDIVDSAGKDAHQVHARQSAQDTFSWMSQDGTLRIDFGSNNPADHPFLSTTPPPYTTQRRGDATTPVQVDPTKPPRRYKYTITLHGANKCVEDPQVIIDTGVGDGDLSLLRDTHAAQVAAERVVDKLFKQLGSVSHSKGDTIKFFPEGIELISVDVEVGGAKVLLTVAGPKAPSE